MKRYERVVCRQVGVITGRSSGNRRAIAKLFAQHGADIVVADVQRSPREGGTPTDWVVEGSTDASATFVECDVFSTDDLEDAIETADGVDFTV